MFDHARTALAGLALGLMLTAPALGQDLAQPEGEVILVVTGKIAATNHEGSARFDLAMLETLDNTVIETSTIWSEGVQRFEGVSLLALTQALGIAGGTLRATAINDYTIEIPLSDATEGGPIIAYRLNGAEMSVRDKGPLWVIYPFDADAAYRTEVIYARSIWQLDRIEAVD